MRGGALAGCAAIALGSVWLLRGGGLERTSQVAGVAGVFIGLAGLVLSVLQRRQPPAVWADDASRLDRMLEALAVSVTAQWDAEAGLRELRRPAPARLTWKATRRPVAPPAAIVAGDAIVGRVTRLRLHGHLDEVAEKFLALPYRRLVVLGEPGGGKTVLAMLLTLQLLENRQPGSAVPVLLGLASWDPSTEHLHTWMARRLGEDYPVLRGRIDRVMAAEKLVTSGRVLPVLDGLDELPEGLQATAIRELDRARAGQPLVLTCRSREYQQAVAAGGETMTAAAVVELEPVTAADAVGFLSATAAVAARWSRVTAELRAAPDGALAAALSTPLMVALARTVYATPGGDPGALVDLAKAGGQAAVERHLLDGFVPAAFTDPPLAPGGRSAHPTWEAERARRWLGVLATHLHQQHTRDLAWWRLSRLVPRFAFGLVVGLAVVLAVVLALMSMFALLSALQRWPTAGLVASLKEGFTFGVGYGAAVGLVAGVMVAATRARNPTRITTPTHGRMSTLAFGFVVVLAAALAAGFTVGLARWLAFGFTVWLEDGIVVVVAVVLAIYLAPALAAGLAGRLMGWLVLRRSLAEDAVAATPSSDFRNNKAVGITGFLAVGVAVGLAIVLAGDLTNGLVFGAVFGLVFGFRTTAWGQFTIAWIWLGLQGRLPWRLMGFLEDAHRRGVLRQAGAVYQFRHARLQDHLADTEPV